MDRVRFTTIAHGSHERLSPISAGRADRLLDALGTDPACRTIDVGCGKGGFLLRRIERSGGSGVGIDTNPAFLAEARERQAQQAPDAAIEWIEGDASFYPAAPASFDAAICLGATHALGGFVPSLQTLQRWVKPGGRMLVGEGYWKREPDPDYLEFLGAKRDEFLVHDANRMQGEALGMRSVTAEESSLEEWDAYENPYADAVERFAAEHPDDPDTPAMLERIRLWRAAYLRWGRETLGFGVYLFEVPSRG
jgi:SAM-dependent methyltransferase